MAKGKRRATPMFEDFTLSNIVTIDNSSTIKDAIDVISCDISSDKVTVEGENISLTDKIKQMESKKKIKKIRVRF